MFHLSYDHAMVGSGVGQVAMDGGDGPGGLADRRGAAPDRTGPDVTRREYAGQACFHSVGFAVENPALRRLVAFPSADRAVCCFIPLPAKRISLIDETKFVVRKVVDFGPNLLI
jgi:hypothetical protein